MSALIAPLAPPRGLTPPPRRPTRLRRGCAAVFAAAFGQPRPVDPFGAPPAPRRAPPPPPPPAPVAYPPPSAAAAPPPWAGEPPPRFPVPEALRMPGAPACTALPRLLSLETVFPGSGLADAFHTNAAFRSALRTATRRDLFRDPGRGAAAAAQMVALGSTCVLDWRLATAPDAVCAAMDAALAAAGVRLRGAELLSGLAALCAVPAAAGGATPAGSLTDIADTGRKQVAHSWHCDSGLQVNTILMGFPAHDDFDGAGCFTHIVALSHPLGTGGAPRGAVIEWERCCAAAGLPAQMPPQYVLRPRFGRGAELLLYSDEAHLHSAPDAINREAVWRFM